jgi:hypothetical protein
MDEVVVAFVVSVAVALILIGLFTLKSVDNTRTCRMEAAAKGYNVKEICE